MQDIANLKYWKMLPRVNVKANAVRSVLADAKRVNVNARENVVKTVPADVVTRQNAGVNVVKIAIVGVMIK